MYNKSIHIIIHVISPLACVYVSVYMHADDCVCVCVCVCTMYIVCACVYMSMCVYVHTEQKYSREVRIISVDFSDGMKIYPNLAEQLRDLDIGTLGE